MAKIKKLKLGEVRNYVDLYGKDNIFIIKELFDNGEYGVVYIGRKPYLATLMSSRFINFYTHSIGQLDLRLVAALQIKGEILRF